MSDQDTVNNLQERLRINRATLRLYLSQRDMAGAAHVRPEVIVGIGEARREIARLKAGLRGLQVAVEDQPDDEEPEEEGEAPPARARRPPRSRGMALVAGALALGAALAAGALSLRGPPMFAGTAPATAPPTEAPAGQPTEAPAPTAQPAEPTEAPTQAPTAAPTATPPTEASTGEPTAAPPPTPAGLISFVAQPAGQPANQIYAMPDDGAVEALCLTCELDPALYRQQPAWSPDGRQMALTMPVAAAPGAAQDVALLGRDGELRSLTASVRGSLSSPSWSPDGRWIVFVAERDGEPYLAVIGSQGGAERVLEFEGRPLVGLQPAWSPDGSRIAFVRPVATESDIYTLVIDEQQVRGVTQLTNSGARDAGPVWSPDSSQIAFHSQRGGSWDIYLMDAQGNNERPLTTSSRQEYQPAWSPDGSRLAYFVAGGQAQGRGDLFTVPIAGGEARPLTSRGDIVDSRIDWSVNWLAQP